MKTTGKIRAVVAFAVSALVTAPAALAAVAGISGQNFTLAADDGYVSVADGGSIYSWGYSVNGSAMQLPGPTLIVTQGQPVTITLNNDLPPAAGNVSIVVPGQDVSATGGVSGAITREAPTAGSVSYTFTPNEPGTYQYHSGTRPDLQVEMGLYGAIVVRPSSIPADCGAAAYDHEGACYDREYLFITSSIDLQVHQSVEAQMSGPGPVVPPEDAFLSSEYWLLNGRVGPDTMAANGTDVLEHQPYGSLARMHPGEKVLLRVVGAGREIHPFHHHGNHARVIARDGHMLVNELGSLAGPLVFTIPSIPGSTTDAIFEWTGKEMGWDMYGHSGDTDCVDDDGDGYADANDAAAGGEVQGEWCADHGKAIPVKLPSFNSLAFGGFYGGSPFLGDLGSLPPGEGGLNPGAGFAFMWHSHTERELVNNDVFPGGMMTMMIVEAPFVEIVE